LTGTTSRASAGSRSPTSTASPRATAGVEGRIQLISFARNLQTKQSQV
jgi:hypothetical protein